MTVSLNFVSHNDSATKHATTLFGLQENIVENQKCPTYWRFTQDVTKIQTTKLLILPRFYFYDV